MFVSEKLVYLQLQKTGCTHIAGLLAELIGGEQIGKHNSLPRHLFDRFIIGSIRNPWDWYVSRWAFGCRRVEKRGRMWNTVSRHLYKRYVRLLPFAPRKAIDGMLHERKKPIEDWKACYADCNDPKLFQKWIRMVYSPERKYDFGEDYGFSSLSGFAGLYTYLYFKIFSKRVRRIYGNSIRSLEDLTVFDTKHTAPSYIIRTESIEEDLIKALQLAGCALSDAQVNSITSRQKRNTTTVESGRCRTVSRKKRSALRKAPTGNPNDQSSALLRFCEADIRSIIRPTTVRIMNVPTKKKKAIMAVLGKGHSPRHMTQQAKQRGTLRPRGIARCHQNHASCQ